MRKIILLLVVAMAGYFFIGCQETTEVKDEAPKKEIKTDYEAIAQKLVKECANVREGDLVHISGGIHDVELLENMANDARKVGAFPFIELWSDRLTKGIYEDVPEKYDSVTNLYSLKLAEFTTVVIGVETGEAEDLLADITAERIITKAKSNSSIDELMQERNTRRVYLGNAIYPTEDRAKLFGITQAELSDIFWAGVNIDYAELQTIGESVKTILNAGKVLHLTHANGTDLKMQIEGRVVMLSDGVISEEEEQIGGAACMVWLPAGEVYLTPVTGTAEGKVIVEKHFFQGKEINDIEMIFEKGKLTSMDAASGLEPIKEMYDASEACKEMFGVIDIGINPNVKLESGSPMLTWMSSGLISIMIGNDTWAGGDNNCEFGFFCHLPGYTLKVDEKILVEDGVLKL